MTVYSPINGSVLEPTSVQNIYRDPVYLMEYIVNNDVVTRMASPASGGKLVRNSDGTYNDPYIGQTFSFDSRRNAFIPHYIPDDTVEPAHIEGDFLVGNNTGRKFGIDSNGRVLTPEEISFQARQGQDLARIQQMEEDGTIDSYLEQAMYRSRKAQQELEAKRKDGTLSEHLKSLLDDKKDKPKHILSNFDEIVANLGEQSVEVLDELLSYFNAGNIQVGDQSIEAYSDPLIASKINARYRVLTGNDHSTFIERVPQVISSYMRSKSELMKLGGYFNEQYFTDLANIQDYIDLMTKGKTVEEKPSLKEYHQKHGFEFPDIYYNINDLKEKAASGEITATELKRLCEIAFGSNSQEAQMIYDAMIKSGKVIEQPEEKKTEKAK